MTSLNYDFQPSSYWPVGAAEATGSSRDSEAGGRQADASGAEATIARVEIGDVTRSTYWILATRRDAKIHYHVVGGDFEQECGSSVTPLSMSALIQRIDAVRRDESIGPGLTGSIRDWNYEEFGGDPETYVSFVEVYSDFYPDLHQHYDDEAATWLAAIQESELREELRSLADSLDSEIALRFAPPLNPVARPGGTRLDALSRGERDGFQRWLRLADGYDEATIAWSPHSGAGWGRAERSATFTVNVRRGGDSRAFVWTGRAGGHEAGSAPTVNDFFAAICSEATLDVDVFELNSEVAGTCQELIEAGDDALAAGLRPIADDCFVRAEAKAQPTAAELGRVADFHFAIGNLTHAKSLWEAVRSAPMHGERQHGTRSQAQERLAVIADRQGDALNARAYMFPADWEEEDTGVDAG